MKPSISIGGFFILKNIWLVIFPNVSLWDKTHNMKNTNKLDVWMISRISAFTGFSIGSTQGDLVVWYLNDGKNHYEIHLDFKKKQLTFVDWVGDDKTYYSLVGIAMMAEFTTEDYFSE